VVWRDIGILLIVFGAFAVLLGVLFVTAPKIPLGRLPGDIVIEKHNFKLYIPITTSLLLSGILTLILIILSHILRR